MNYLRILDKYDTIIKLGPVVVMFVLLYNQLIYIDTKVQLVGEKTQELLFKDSIKNTDDYEKRDLMKDLTANDKLMRVYMGSQAREFYPLTPPVINYFKTVKNAIEDDSNNAFVYGQMAKGIALKVARYNTDNKTVEFYNKWEMQVTGDDDPWLKNFPKSPYLAMNSEIIPWPNCSEDQRPTIAVEPVRAVNSNYEFDVRVRELDKVRSWQVVFDGVDILDSQAVYGMRSIVIWACKSADVKDETNE